MRESRWFPLSDSFRLAIGTLSTLPVPPPRVVNQRVAGRAMLLAPAVLLGPALLLGCFTAVGAGLAGPPLVVAALGLGLLGWLNRGLHLDGLADTADGLAASYDPQRSLEVMRTPEVGAAGAATLALVLLAQAGALAELLRWGWRGSGCGALAVVGSRVALAVACAGPGPAQQQGLGASVAASVRWWQAGLLVLGVGLGLSAMGFFLGAPPALGLVAVVAGALSTCALLWRCGGRLGGITGDVLGAGVELCFLVNLLIWGCGLGLSRMGP